MISESVSLDSLAIKLFNENSLQNLEKCVVLLQMYTYVGDDLYHQADSNLSNQCSREESEKFIKDNATLLSFNFCNIF